MGWVDNGGVRFGLVVPQERRVDVSVPSTMGGASLRRCGAAARAFCRDQGRSDRTIAAACRRQGYAIETLP